MTRSATGEGGSKVELNFDEELRSPRGSTRRARAAAALPEPTRIPTDNPTRLEKGVEESRRGGSPHLAIMALPPRRRRYEAVLGKEKGNESTAPQIYIQLGRLRRAGEIRAMATAFVAAVRLWQGKINSAPKPMID